MSNFIKELGLTTDDNLTSKEYVLDGFKPSTEVNEFSYTSARVANPIYNTYEKNEFKVFGYYTDWSQYDSRQFGIFGGSACGRGVDMMSIDPNAYDKIILGFLGIYGDIGEKTNVINKGAADFGIVDNINNPARRNDMWWPTFCDSWGDVLSYSNCGFAGWVSDNAQDKYGQDSAQGVMGGMRKWHEKNPSLRLSLSIGGWTMSQGFHYMAKDVNYRKAFCDGVIDIYNRFPMLNEIDLDWEYPGVIGNEGGSFAANTFDDADAKNYVLLVSELKQSLNENLAEPRDVRISIALSADVDNIKKTNLPALIDAGVWGINLMTYDFFGTPWAEGLGHHTNLLPYGGPGDYSIEKAVDFIEQSGIPLNKVFIGYAAYGCSAQNANITSVSPLFGTYTPNVGHTTLGTFQSGTIEYYDLIYNYVNYEDQNGRNGYDIFTDEVANADYLYNPVNNLFISIDTPRSVKEKGEYVVKRNLGGLFTWTVDMDHGLLVNAAREGLGCVAIDSVVNMQPLYFKGKSK